MNAFGENTSGNSMRIQEILEDATAGATTSANVAVVVNPDVTNPNLGKGKKNTRKKNKPTDNALDAGDNLMGASGSKALLKRPY